jgi:hypothetical protein
MQPLRLTSRGKRLLERAVPAWEEAQQRAKELLGEKAVSQLNNAAKKLGRL